MDKRKIDSTKIIKGDKVMESLTYKIKISILWISFAVATSAAMIIWFVEPGILEQIINTNVIYFINV